jgi:hypothetical protein
MSLTNEKCFGVGALVHEFYGLTEEEIRLIGGT